MSKIYWCRHEKPSEGESPLWGELVAAAQPLNELAKPGGLEVAAAQITGAGIVEDGLWAGDKWTDYFASVRWRPRRSTIWEDVQPVSEAAEDIARFLRERPDLAG
jgi:hypothetical protein